MSDLQRSLGGRRESRERAIELGYEAQQRGSSVEEIIAPLPTEPDDFVLKLLAALENKHSESTALIEGKATGWKLTRMPVLDLLIMRMAVAEMLVLDTPTGVILSESVELASMYSTPDSGKFVNGILSAIANDVRADGDAR